MKTHLQNKLLELSLFEIEESFIIKDYSELIFSLNSIDKKKKLKYLYTHRKNIEKILYDEDQVLIIDNNTIDKNDNLYNYFYLYEIINNNKDIINYKYDFELVNELYKRVTKEERDLRKFILNILLYSILYNFEQSYDPNSSSEEDNDKYEQIYNSIDEFMKKQHHLLNKYNLNLDLLNYKSFKIEHIYVEIIISLIRNKKLENFECVKDLEQLDITNIDLTHEMFIGLKKEFDENSNKKYIADYKFKNNEDLFNEKFINFYYILFTYIFKNQFYIFNIKFLNEERKSLKKIVKDNNVFSRIENLSNNSLKEKISNALKIFLDSYCIILKSKRTKIKRRNITKQNINYNNLISKNKDFFYKNLHKKKLTKEEEEKIKYETFLDIVSNNKINITLIPENDEEDRKIMIEFESNDISNFSEYQFNKCRKYFSKDKTSEGYKIFKYLDDFLERLKNEYKNDLTLLIQLKINKTNINEFESIYSFNNIKSYKDFNFEPQSFPFFIEEINCEKYSKVKKIKIDEISEDEIYVMKRKTYDDYTRIYHREIKNHEYKILYFKRVIGNHNENGRYNSATFIKEFSHLWYSFISGGTDKTLKLYNRDFYEYKVNLWNEIRFTNIIHAKNIKKENNDNLYFYACTNREIILYNLDYGNFQSNIISSTAGNVKYNNLIQIKNGKNYNLVIAGNFGVLYITNENKQFYHNINKLKILKGKEYMGLIQINKNLIALTSNKAISGGEDILVIFDLENLITVKEIKGRSFIASPNGLAFLIPESLNEEEKDESKEEEKYLICACKKYFKDQDNGILLINMNDNKYNSKFYNTRDFEVHCFCQIMEPSYKKIRINDFENEISPTNFFLVGGFDTIKREGLIKLYKLIGDTNQKEIKFLQDIEFQKDFIEKEEEMDNEQEQEQNSEISIFLDQTYISFSNKINDTENEVFHGFEGAISSIIQSISSWNILVSCYDGKISLLSKINLEMYD